MQEQQLLDIIKCVELLHPDFMYDALIIINDINSTFDMEEKFKFLINAIYVNTGENNIAWLDIYKKHPERFVPLMKKWDDAMRDWYSVKGVSADSEKSTMKLYVSIDNACLHCFANKVISSALEQGFTDLNFKINNNDSINRRDSVVIYCNEQNVGRYVKLVSDVLKDSIDIKLNDPHLLACPVVDDIYCAMDFDDGNTSYTEKMSETICNDLRNGKSPELVVSSIGWFIQSQKSKFESIIDKSVTQK